MTVKYLMLSNLEKYPFLSFSIAGNSVLRWLAALIIFLITLLILRIVRDKFVKKIGQLTKKTSSKIDDIIVEAFSNTGGLFFIIVALFVSSKFLNISINLQKSFFTLFALGLLIQGGVWLSFLTGALIRQQIQSKHADDPAKLTALGLLVFAVRVAIWSVVALLILDNFGIDVTALVAGLGVGGVAVALAVQNILGDLLASLSIVFDKPFEVGDFIIVDDLLGTVERIGIKTTRLRSLSGEQLVFNNSDLLSSRIKNFKRMYERRVVFTLGVTYQTSYENLQKIPEMIKAVILKQANVRFDRAHFKSYGDFALIFEIVYFVLVPEFNIYMDIQQSINLELFQLFAENSIEFAYPTQTLFLEKS